LKIIFKNIETGVALTINIICRLFNKKNCNILSLSYLSRCGPLRAGSCGVSGRNKGSTGRKIFFSLSAKLSCALNPKLL
jgi:hypothetical protein